MSVGQHTRREVHGCILLIPSDLFRDLEREATRQGLSPEAFLLRLLESRIERTRGEEPTGRRG